MIDLSKYSMEELKAIEDQIAIIKATKIRTYRVTFDITFKASRDDDLAEPDSFESHIYDAFKYFDLKSPEGITNVDVKEI